MQIFLASSSPRRRLLLQEYSPTIYVPKNLTEERKPPSGEPSVVRQTVCWNAEHKCMQAVQELKQLPASFPPPLDHFVVGADTLVHDELRWFGKPTSLEEAEQFLVTLTQREHQVTSGVFIYSLTTGFSRSFSDTTRLRLCPMTLAEIRALFARVPPLDKAGAYNIGESPEIVQSIDGDPTNVMGLPMARFKEELEALRKPRVVNEQPSQPRSCFPSADGSG